jgi:hypothetical protein
MRQIMGGRIGQEREPEDTLVHQNLARTAAATVVSGAEIWRFDGLSRVGKERGNGEGLRGLKRKVLTRGGVTGGSGGNGERRGDLGEKWLVTALGVEGGPDQWGQLVSLTGGLHPSVGGGNRRGYRFG